MEGEEVDICDNMVPVGLDVAIRGKVSKPDRLPQSQIQEHTIKMESAHSFAS